MPKKENKTKTIKIRVTESEYEAIAKLAAQGNDTLSSIIRDALFTKDNNDINTGIQTELFKQQLYNLIQHTPMPKDSRKILIKELDKHDSCRY